MIRWPIGLAAVAGLAFGAAAARALTLDSVLVEVATRNPALAASSARTDAARARVAPAGAWQNPMIEAGVANVPVNGRFDMDPMTMKTLGITQRIAPWGAGGLARDAARSAVGAAEQDARVTRQRVLGETVEAYVAAWSAGERVAASSRHLGLLSRSVEAARSRYAAGTGRLEDALRARAEEGLARSELSRLRAEQRTARLQLSALRDQAPEFEGEPLAPPSLTPVPDDAASWLAAVDENQPRLLAGDAEAERYRLAAQASRRMVWPELELSYEYGFRGELEGGIPQDDMFSAHLGVMLPIFAGSRERSEAAEMEAMEKMARSERRSANLELLQSVAAAHEQARAATANARVLADTVLAVGRSALDAAWTSYASGATELARVIDTAHLLYQGELELTRARQSAMEAQGRFLALTGRGDLIGIALPAAKEVRP